MRFAPFVLLLAPAVAFADPAPILGGTPTTPGSYPTVVAIGVAGGLCTGTLIAPDWVLTAGHCTSPSTLMEPNQQAVTSSIVVVFDSTTPLNGSGMQVSAVDSIPNPNFNPNTLENDLGLIKLAQPITGRTIVALNRSHDAAPGGMAVDMVGYGIHTAGTQDAGTEFTLLNKATITCGSIGLPDQTLLCYSQMDGSGKCEGDSGGPSFAKINNVEYQVGITSFGTDQACADYGADTRVDAYVDWIDQTTGGDSKCVADGACTPSLGCGTGGLPVDPDCPLCTTDMDCGTDMVCGDNGMCEPAPLTPGGLGSDCTSTACAVGVCASGPGGMKCSTSCDPNDATTCPDGFDCLGASGAQGACWPGSGGGCCSTSGSPAAPSIVIAGFVLLGLRRRRS